MITRLFYRKLKNKEVLLDMRYDPSVPNSGFNHNSQIKPIRQGEHARLVSAKINLVYRIRKPFCMECIFEWEKPINSRIDTRIRLIKNRKILSSYSNVQCTKINSPIGKNTISLGDGTRYFDSVIFYIKLKDIGLDFEETTENLIFTFGNSITITHFNADTSCHKPIESIMDVWSGLIQNAIDFLLRVKT